MVAGQGLNDVNYTCNSLVANRVRHLEGKFNLGVTVLDMNLPLDRINLIEFWNVALQVGYFCPVGPDTARCRRGRKGK